MKKYIPLLIVLVVIYQLTYLSYLQLKKQRIQVYANKENSLEVNKVKKISYGEGEYIKHYKDWISRTNDLYESLLKALNINFEKEVIHNYIVNGEKYYIIWQEITLIDPPEKYKVFHDNILDEVITGTKLCSVYVNNISKYDNYFVQLVKKHQKNLYNFSRIINHQDR